jgi:hypothetical protein
VRAHSTTRLVYELANELNLKIEEIDPISFLPTPQPKELISLEKMMLCFTINNSENFELLNLNSEPSEPANTEEDMSKLSAPF